MKILFTVLFFVLSISCSFGQVFFKQRVYGMEDREPKKEVVYFRTTYSSNSYSYSSNSKKKKSKKTYYHISDNTQAYSWKTAELRTKRKYGFYYIGVKETNHLIPLIPAIDTFRELGKHDLANSITRARTVFIVAKSTQIASWVVGVPTIMTIWAADGDEAFVNQDHYNVLYACIGTWVGSKITMLLCKASIDNSLRKHNNSVLENREDKEKNFYQNLKPSKITFKPVQISPFTPSLAPTLGFSWKL